VRAALRAAAERPAAPLVLADFRAAAEREEGLRRLAADLPCLDSARVEADARDSRFSAELTARDRRRETVFLPFFPAS